MTPLTREMKWAMVNFFSVVILMTISIAVSSGTPPHIAWTVLELLLVANGVRLLIKG